MVCFFGVYIDYSLFHDHKHKATSFGVYISVYVDDVIITVWNANEISKLKNFLHQRFKLKDLGNLKYILGIEVSRSRKGICLNQQYALDIIKDTVLLRAKPEPFLMEQNLKLNNIDGNILNNPAYISIWFEDLYLSPGQSILLPFHNELQLWDFCDSNWAKRSTTSYCVFLGNNLKIKKNSPLSLDLLQKSAKYRVMAVATCELQWVWYLLPNFGISHYFPSVLYCDNKAAMYIATNLIYHELNQTHRNQLPCCSWENSRWFITYCIDFFQISDWRYVYKGIGQGSFPTIKRKVESIGHTCSNLRGCLNQALIEGWLFLIELGVV